MKARLGNLMDWFVFRLSKSRAAFQPLPLFFLYCSVDNIFLQKNFIQWKIQKVYCNTYYICEKIWELFFELCISACVCWCQEYVEYFFYSCVYVSHYFFWLLFEPVKMIFFLCAFFFFFFFWKEKNMWQQHYYTIHLVYSHLLFLHLIFLQLYSFNQKFSDFRRY